MQCFNITAKEQRWIVFMFIIALNKSSKLLAETGTEQKAR